MNQVKIFTDSCSDLTKDLREKYGIEYVKMNTEYEGKETPASLDWEYYTPRELYGIMRNGNRVFTTQVPQTEFIEHFTKWAEQGCDIVYVGCSTKQSGSVNTGYVVAKDVMEKFPNVKIYVIDALNACMGEGLLAIRAAEYRNAGMSADDIYEKIMAERNNVNQYVTVHSLDALKRAGRVKASAAFFGNLLGVKPILISDKNGVQTPIKKVKGRGASIQEVVNLIKENGTDLANQTLYIVHADCLEEAQELAKTVKEQTGCKETYVSYIGPIIGASIGPDAIGVYGWGKEVTYAVDEQ